MPHQTPFSYNGSSGKQHSPTQPETTLHESKPTRFAFHSTEPREAGGSPRFYPRISIARSSRRRNRHGLICPTKGPRDSSKKNGRLKTRWFGLTSRRQRGRLPPASPEGEASGKRGWFGGWRRRRRRSNANGEGGAEDDAGATKLRASIFSPLSLARSVARVLSTVSGMNTPASPP